MTTFRNIAATVGSITSGLTLAHTLGLIGLERRRSTTSHLLPVLGAFGIGITVGAGLGLLLAPQPGARLRSELGKKAEHLGEEVKSKVTGAEKALAERAEAAVPRPNMPAHTTHS